MQLLLRAAEQQEQEAPILVEGCLGGAHCRTVKESLTFVIRCA